MPVIDMNDETLLTYLEESREHLSDIESNLLAIEENGADIDENLVNTVFRAAHSIKGGAGFFELVKIRNLAHKIENVLDSIRNRDMVPTPEVINILLLSFDKLREMVNSPAESNDEDIDEFVRSLTNLTSETLPEEKKETLNRMVDISLPDGRVLMQMTEFDYNRTIENNNSIYLIELDLIHDLQSRGIVPLEYYRGLIGTGTIESIITDFEAVGSLDDEFLNRLPMYVLFSSILTSDKIKMLFEVDDSRITVIHNANEDGSGDSDAKAAESEAAEASLDADESATVEEPVSEDKAEEKSGEEKQTPEEPVLRQEPARPSGGAKKPQVLESSSTLRVKVKLLEQLMALAGELVLSRNELQESINKKDMNAIVSGGQRMSHVTSELQEAIMMTRMQDIGSIFNKFPRIVRDLSRNLGKQINLNVTGREVELDKTLIEGLNDPLTHMIRNAVDHGIEDPDTRLSAGKDPVGSVELRAYHEAGLVVIEVEDDGKGIDGTRIAEKAVSRGLISREEAAALSEAARAELILLPGLSTVEKVTDVSGRGVGMDVVKSNIDSLGGITEIKTVVGKGSVFRIKLPLTLAIIPSLLVSQRDEFFAIPQINIEELIRIKPGDIKNRIERLGTIDVLNLRGKLVPLVFLTDITGMQPSFKDPETGELLPDRRAKISDRRGEPQEQDFEIETEHRNSTDRRFHADSVLNIVIVSTGNITYGILVDRLHDSMEIVVKPLGKHLRVCREYAGATIMGDGSVCLILDVSGIANNLRMSSVSSSLKGRENRVEDSAGDMENTGAYLLFRNSPEEYCAMPLDLVGRVEYIDSSRIEVVGGRRIMQYMGKGLPLVRLEDSANTRSLPEDNLAVIVFNAYGREIGLLATQPVDFIEQEMIIDRTSLQQPGISGSVIIDGRTTMLLDVFEMVKIVYPEWADEKLAQTEKTGNTAAGSSLVMVAEDSAFFRKQLVSYIEGEGFSVISAEDGEAAWNMMKSSSRKIDLLVTDIEMPNLDGYGLAAKVRVDEKYSELPIIAVTSLAGDENISKGMAVGITEYQVKLDREKLIQAIKHILVK